MKKFVIKKHLSILLLFAMLIGLMAPAASANASATSKATLLKYKETTIFLFKNKSYNTDYIGFYDSWKNVVSVKSSKSSVISVEATDNGEGVELTIKKTGKTTITIKKKNGKTHKCKVTVVKYKNPFKSFKLGKIKVEFEKNGNGTWMWDKDPFPESGRAYTVSIKLKKGYSSLKIQCRHYNYKKDKYVYRTVKNNSKVKFDEAEELIISCKDKKSGKRLYFFASPTIFV